ncbi:MAG: hypothetical protein IPP78_15715 [Holophagaceae bacterium]|nr:hypothetical protein [Holophagaceae bacterium]
MRTVSIITLLVFTFGGFAQNPPWAAPSRYPPSKSHRANVISILSSGKSRGEIIYNEELIAEAGYWYSHGDTEALGPLMAAAKHSDGAISEALGCILGEALMKHPRMVLSSATRFSVQDQKRIGMLAVSADGSGFPPDEMKQIRFILLRYSRNQDSKLAATAKCWIVELNKEEAMLKDYEDLDKK